MITAVSNDPSQKEYICPRCNVELKHRVHRAVIVKALLFFLPVKRFKCYKCRKKYYFFY